MATPDPRGRAMLRAYRNAKAQPGERLDAVWSRIEDSIDAGVAGPSLEPSSVAPATATTPVWVVPVVAGAVAVAAIVIAMLALRPAAERDLPGKAPMQAPHGLERPSPASPLEPRGLARVDGVAEDSVDEAPSPSVPVIAPRSSPVPSAARRRAPRQDESEPTPTDEPAAVPLDELRAEMALIREARQALRDERPAGALEVLDAHARAFPAGQMREDRQALRIEALCAADKAPQARAEIQLFLRAFPSSAHAKRVRAMCPAR